MIEANYQFSIDRGLDLPCEKHAQVLGIYNSKDNFPTFLS